MKHMIKSNLYLIFWADKYFGAAVLAMLVAPVIILQGHFSAYAIGLSLSVYFALLKFNSTVTSSKHEKINAAMPVKKEDIVTSRFVTAAYSIGMFTVVSILVSVWANSKKVIYESDKMDYSLRKVIIHISTPIDELIAGLIFGILLSVIISSVYLYLWSKYDHDKYNLYFTMFVLIFAFALKPLMEGLTDAGISMIFVNVFMLIVAVPIAYFTYKKSLEAFKTREF
jgi:hypothetical protein